MSLRDVFWLCAGMSISAALAFVLPAFVRALPARRGLRIGAAAAAIIVFTLSGLGIYRILGEPGALERHGGTPPHPPALTAGSGNSLEAATRGLAARLRTSGGSDADWELLAQSYEQMGDRAGADAARRHSLHDAATTQVGPGDTGTRDAQKYRDLVAKNPADSAAWIALARIERSGRDYDAALAAYRKAIALSAMRADDWADYADVLASSTGRLSGAPAKAIAAALALEPKHAKALWLQASLALEEHRYADALRDWRALRAVVPDESSDARIVDANIEEARSLAGQQPAPGTPAASPALPTVAIRGTVDIDPALASRVMPGMTLFVFARAAEGSGPPLAVLRVQPTRWPVTFQLDDSLAMLPSRRLSGFDRVIVEARLSKSGQALAQAGDLQVASGIVRTSNAAPLALRISKIVS
jgi:cytochrome c-type biogenesis protein CcmH/NrfG